MTNVLRSALAATAAAGLLAGLAACSASDSPSAAEVGPTVAESSAPSLTAKPSAKSTAAPKVQPGALISQAEYEKDPAQYSQGDVVLFFNASWCPTCQEAHGNLVSQPIPDGLTVVDVDYDENTQLKQEYGVTTQHTFVQVDSGGQELAKFTGATTAEEISGQLS